LPEGEALARTSDGDAYRLRHAVPDDVVALTPIKKRRGIAYAQLEHVEQASPMRVSAACSVAKTCGGCALQYVQEEAQASIKSAWVKHAFAPALQADTEWQAIHEQSLDEGSQRRRVRWQVAKHSDAVHLGFFAHQSHNLVVTSHCMVLTDSLNELHEALEMCFSESLIQNDCESLPESVYAVQLHDGVHVVLTYATKVSLQPMALPQLSSKAVQYWQRCGTSLKPISRPVQVFHDVLPISSSSQVQSIALQIGADDFVSTIGQ